MASSSINSTPTMLLFLFSIVCLNTVYVLGQSNYASHGNNINYIGNGLPEETVLDGKVTKLDDLSPIIFLNRTKAALNCGAGSMEVDLKFNEKFYGVAYADFDRNSACQIIGKGDLSYKIEFPLKGCGTKQDPQRVFTNNIVVRFHPGLEMDGDEIITIVCRYPPPIAPVPAPLPIAPIGPDPRLAEIITAPLRGTQILFIICALMFLTLLLLGLGVSYYCLRRRTIPVVRRLPMYMGSGSEITKLSGSSLGNLSVFEEGLKIPRAHVPVLAVQSSSDTLPSDYPSESHSEIEEVDTRSLPHSSVSSYENHAYLQEASSVYSENLGQIHVQEIQAVAVAKAPSPKFDVQVRVKRAPPPPPSISSSSETESAASRTERNNLSTIMESHEDRESILTVDSLPHITVQKQFTYMPEIHPAPKYDAHPLGYSTLNKGAQQYRRHWPEDLADGPPITQVEEIETHTVTETIDEGQPTYTTRMDIENLDSLEPPIHVIRKPEITSAVVDDVFLRTITEKRTIEDIEKQKRMVTEYKVRPMIPDPTWDVTIRNLAENGGPQWEDFSDISSASGIAPPVARAPINVPPPAYISQTGALLRSPEMVGNMKPIEMPEEDKAVPNWEVLIRVLEEPEIEPVVQNRYETSTNILQRQLSYEDRLKWKEIITTESTLRKMLTEAVVREDFERISRDIRYERIFEPQSWDVIIRILAPPDDDVKLREPRGSKKQPWDTRSRRSSLPTLYEYDSDGGSSVRTIRQDLIVSQPQPGPSHAYMPHSRRTSRSSYRSGSDFVDMRSMAETTVDFTRPDSYFDKTSEGSSYQPRYYDDDRYSDHRSLHRSISHPSLARSESEFMEQWVAPQDEMSSPEGSPRMRRTQRVLTTFQPRPTNTTTSGSTQRVVTSEAQYTEQRTMKYQTGDSSQWYSKHQ